MLSPQMFHDPNQLPPGGVDITRFKKKAKYKIQLFFFEIFGYLAGCFEIYIVVKGIFRKLQAEQSRRVVY